MPVAMDFVTSVTAENFNELVLRTNIPVVAEFMSYGCEHCRLLEPVLQKVAEKLGARELIFRVNIATEQTLADRYQIEGTPTLVMFWKGVEIGRAIGPDPSMQALWDAVTIPFEGQSKNG